MTYRLVVTEKELTAIAYITNRGCNKLVWVDRSVDEKFMDHGFDSRTWDRFHEPVLKWGLMYK